ncbi:MAG: hypothetical protein SVY53_14135 [Chloroflexota bacterium]|nr:hypothetical protein [Chloroflexota bacterium]
MKRYWCKVNDEWVYEFEEEDVPRTERALDETIQTASESDGEIDVISLVAQPISAGWGRQ